MRSTSYSSFCQKLFGNYFIKQKTQKQIFINLLLEKANIQLSYEEYASTAVFTSILAFILSLISMIILYAIIPNTFLLYLIIILPFIATTISAIAFYYLPEYLTKKRANNIDRFLPYAINFISSMAGAGVSPSEIFQTLSTIDVYGEIQIEAKRITKEIKIMGIDNITALKHAIELSPSRKFKSFIQGMIGTIQSGSDLQNYLVNIVDKYLEEDIVERKKNLDLLAVVAESFVIAVIAFPIFLVIILSIMGFFGGSMSTSISVLYIFSFLVLPATYFGFYILISSTTTSEISKIQQERNMNLRQYYDLYKTPISIFVLSLIVFFAFALTILILANYGYFKSNIYLLADIVLIGILIIIGPVSIYQHQKNKEKWDMQDRLPDFLTEVGDSLTAGMTALEAIKVAEKGRYGKLGPEIKKMKAQLSWNISVRDVFNNFANRMRSGIIKRIVVTINEGLMMGGHNSRIFKAAATEVNQVNQIEHQRKANMAVYMSVILLCFFVFLAIILIIDKTIFSTFFDLQTNQAESAQGIIQFNVIDQLQLEYALFSFVFVQSIGAGVLAGYMMDGKLASGVRYGIVLAIISFIVFKLLF